MHRGTCFEQNGIAMEHKNYVHSYVLFLVVVCCCLCMIVMQCRPLFYYVCAMTEQDMWACRPTGLCMESIIYGALLCMHVVRRMHACIVPMLHSNVLAFGCDMTRYIKT